MLFKKKLVVIYIHTYARTHTIQVRVHKKNKNNSVFLKNRSKLSQNVASFPERSYPDRSEYERGLQNSTYSSAAFLLWSSGQIFTSNKLLCLNLKPSEAYPWVLLYFIVRGVFRGGSRCQETPASFHLGGACDTWQGTLHSARVLMRCC